MLIIVIVSMDKMSGSYTVSEIVDVDVTTTREVVHSVVVVIKVEPTVTVDTISIVWLSNDVTRLVSRRVETSLVVLVIVWVNKLVATEICTVVTVSEKRVVRTCKAIVTDVEVSVTLVEENKVEGAKLTSMETITESKEIVEIIVEVVLVVLVVVVVIIEVI